MNKSESIKELATALSKAQAEMDAAKKTGKNPFFKSTYPTFEDVRDASIPSLTKHGLSVIQPTETTGTTLLVNTVLMHSSGEWLSGQYPVLSAKQDPQSIKSALTYARRAAWESMVGLASTDDDGNAAQGLHEGKTERGAGNGDYIIQITGKHVGKKLTDMTVEEIEGYKNYWQKIVMEKKQVSGNVRQFLEEAIVYLDRKKTNDHMKSIMRE